MARNVIFPRPLQYLIAIAEYGSYTRAAEVLHVSQPTLSQQIKQLEESLQSPLLDRSGRTVRLTDAGEVYLHHARRAWAELEAGSRAIHDVQGLSRGSLRLGWTPITDYLTCSLLEEFNHRYPSITLNTLEMPQDDIGNAVAEDRIDIGIAFTSTFRAESRSSEIETRILFEEALCLAVGNTHARAGQKERISAHEFGKESLVLLNTNFALRQHVEKYCLENGIAPRIAINTNSLSVIIKLVQVGQLATVLPKSIIRTQCGLHSIVLAPTLPHKAISLIFRKGGYKSPACLAFIELASDWSIRRLLDTPIQRLEPCPMSAEYFRNKHQ
ncbi:MAG: transcriptional regulator CynR [Gammaproteobacteria bacterium]|nr:MAG: transcriptional regulator CynR [Gammaproteobacteria bacterium]